jgi:hypothetical protein
MFQINPSQSHDWQRPTISPADPFHLDNQRHEVLDALDAYRRQARRGWFYRLWSRLRQRPYSLWNLSDVSRLVSVRSRYPAGLQLVPLSAIKGSEGKERDFDGRFHPLRHELSRQRWISIALVRNKGQSLAPGRAHPGRRRPLARLLRPRRPPPHLRRPQLRPARNRGQRHRLAAQRPGPLDGCPAGSRGIGRANRF